MVKTIIKFCLPYGCFYLLQKYRLKKSIAADLAGVVVRDRENALIERDNKISSTPPKSYDEIANYFIDTYNIPAQEVIDGSIPKENCDTIIAQCIRLKKPTLHLLNIGNYLGVALLYIINELKNKEISCLVTIIDPNIPHRGVTDLQTKFFDASQRFGLLKDILLIPGYSLNKSLSNDGVEFNSYNPIQNFDREVAPENVLLSLTKRQFGTFDIAILDGNHNSTYLKNEISQVDKMLNKGGLIVFDDVNDFWSPIKTTVKNFTENYQKTYDQVVYDGRILIAQKKSN